MFASSQLGQSRFFEAVNQVVGVMSRVFGNTVGLVQTRSGKLLPMSADPQTMRTLKGKLKPLDVLLEKTPFRLTDKFIPGYFGHVAIWVGTTEELKSYQVKYNGKMISLLSHPDVIPHLPALSEGKLIVEALRPGTTLNTLEHFMDIDDFAVLESPVMSESETAMHLLRTIQQVGKPYDFNFNVETQRELICSELIYAVFTNQQWPTSVSLGRNTISPDQVAWRAVDSCFKPKLMYLYGKSVSQNLKEELRKVLELPGGIEYTPSSTCDSQFSLSDHPPKN
jgi:hypothetical protein